MEVKSADQITIVDITDAYSVILTNESHIFAGTTTTAKAETTTTTVIAMRGASVINATVNVSEITAPTGVSVVSDGDTTSPTLTISVTTSVTSGGIVKIPVHIGDITINKEFSFGIAFTGSAGTILWENPDPTAAITTMDIALSSEDYDVLDVYWRSSNTSTTTKLDGFVKGDNGLLSEVSYDTESSTLVSYWRAVTYNSNTLLTLDDAGNSQQESCAHKLIPIKIVGRKFI